MVWDSYWGYLGFTHTQNNLGFRAVASLTVPGGQEFHFPNFSSNCDQFSYFSLNFPHFLPHCGSPGGPLAHPGRPWLRHCLDCEQSSHVCVLETGKVRLQGTGIWSQIHQNQGIEVMHIVSIDHNTPNLIWWRHYTGSSLWTVVWYLWHKYIYARKQVLSLLI